MRCPADVPTTSRRTVTSRRRTIGPRIGTRGNARCRRGTSARLQGKQSDGTGDIPELRSATRSQPHALSARLTADDLATLVARYQDGATQQAMADESGLSL